MTAEVAVMNKSAVALAADSTVTVGDPNNPRKVKTYQTANKLFTLSRYQPVGIMIYGNAGLMNVPWETLIKQYRVRLHHGHFDTIKEYSEHFIKFLESCKGLFPDEWKRAYLGASVFSYYTRRLLPPIKKVLEQQEKAGAKPTATEIGVIYDAAIAKHWEEELRLVKLSSNLSKKFEIDLLRDGKVEFAHAIQNAFPNVPLSPVSRRTLCRIGARVVCGDVFPDTLSGVVIAGFGDGQIFPEVRTFSPHFVCRNKLIYRDEPDRSHELSHGDNDAALIPFAQSDVVESFLNGIDPRYSQIVRKSMSGICKSYPNLVAQHIPDDDPDKKKSALALLSSELKKMADAIDAEFRELREKQHTNPLLAVISSLPKNELAELAEALVSITSLKRKVSNDLETVGGPIDVAVISKGDGFIWIRRKHYFRSELNPHFIRNYHREPSHEQRLDS